MRARIASRCGPIRGASHTMVTSIWAMMPPRARTRSHANARKRSDDAPRHCGSLGGKCDADIAIGQRAENGVDQRVQHDVGVGMARQSARVRNAHPAQHDMIAVAEGVHVEAAAGAHVGESGQRAGFGAGKVVIGGQFHVAGLACKNSDAVPGPFGQRRIVGEILAARSSRAAVRVQRSGRKRMPAASAPCAECCDRACR